MNPNQVKSLQPGAHADGGGLYLIVREGGDRAWAFRFTGYDGKRAQMEFAKPGDRDKGDELTLSSAREKAREYRVGLKRDGIDPRHKKRLALSGDKTFKQFADEQYPAWCKGLSREEENQWRRAIADVPSLHNLKLHEIETAHVLAALKPLWIEKPPTASRIRQRIERVLDAAKALKFRTGDNPAMWRGNLKHLLASPRKLHTKKGHTSVAYAKAPALMTALRYDSSTVAHCVEVGILTVARSKEIRLMEWTELDFDAKTWRCPGHKMKMKKDHLVPLSVQAIAIINSMPYTGRYVFPSSHAEKYTPFLPNALTGAIQRAGFRVTMHGCRTTFRNWGGESVTHNFRREVIEHCLAHREGDETEKSYWTGEMIERRRIVLQAWADYIQPIADAKPKSKTPSLTLIA
jgi:integrase